MELLIRSLIESAKFETKIIYKNENIVGTSFFFPEFESDGWEVVKSVLKICAKNGIDVSAKVIDYRKMKGMFPEQRHSEDTFTRPWRWWISITIPLVEEKRRTSENKLYNKLLRLYGPDIYCHCADGCGYVLHAASRCECGWRFTSKDCCRYCPHVFCPNGACRYFSEVITRKSHPERFVQNQFPGTDPKFLENIQENISRQLKGIYKGLILNEEE